MCWGDLKGLCGLEPSKPWNIPPAPARSHLWLKSSSSCHETAGSGTDEENAAVLALMSGLGPPPGLMPWPGFALPPGLEEPFQQPPPTTLCGFGAEAEAFGPPMLGACIRAAAAAGEEAATFPFCEAAAAVCALQLEAELDSLVAKLSQDFLADNVEPLLARAVDQSRAFGFLCVQTHLHDAMMAAWFRHLPIDDVAAVVVGNRTGPGFVALRQMIIESFGRDFSPGAEGQDLQLWSRVLAARYHVYRSGVGGRDPAAVGRDHRRRGARGGCGARLRSLAAAEAAAGVECDTGAEDEDGL